MLQDRRQYQRLAPSSPQLVLLDESKYSLLFDLSEGGLALEGFTGKNPRDVISLEFDLPEGSGCIQARAEVSWTSESGYRTGLRFLEIAQASRLHLQDWIASASSKRVGAIENEIDQPIFAANPPDPAAPHGAEEHQPMSVVPAQPKFEYRAPHLSEEADGFGYEGSSGHLAALFIAVVLMSSIAFLMGYYLHAGRSRHTTKPVQASTAPAARATTTQTPVSADVPSAAVNPSGAPVLPLDVPGFVLQVGAMANEANADALSATLRRKNFPAFVFKHGNDRLYRVVVGPFKDADSAASSKADLEDQGFTPLLRNWTPE